MKKPILFVICFSVLLMAPTSTNSSQVYVDWAHCFYDTTWPLNEMSVDFDAGIVLGQMIGDGTCFPAPITGIVSGGYVYFASNFLTECGLRFWEISTSTAVGTTWGIVDEDSTYYDPPHFTEIAPCSLGSSGPLEGITACSTEASRTEEIIEWDWCVKDTNYVDEFWISLDGKVVLGRMIIPEVYDLPLTGYMRGGHLYFAINGPLPEDQMRFYKVSTSTGAGTTWGIWADGTYFDLPHPCQFVFCPVAQASSDLPSAFEIR